MTMLAVLIAAHFIGDTLLQPGRMSDAKRIDGDPVIPWWQALTAHGAVHGLLVWSVTGIWWLGLAEMLSHMLIDFHKGRGDLNAWCDQALHIGLKIIWAIIAINI